VHQMGVQKPGATIYLEDLEPWEIKFSNGDKTSPNFAYNILRKEFDNLLLNAAIKAGCDVQRRCVRLEYSKEWDRVFIDDYSENQIVIDASGRRRVVAKALNLGLKQGKRNDIALFAHLDKAELPYAGNIHMNVFDEGWSWRIPLPNRVSVGFVADRKFFERFGSDRTLQYDSILKEGSILPSVLGAKRLTDVVKYSNYQLQSHRVYGTNWILVGDSAGFLDPVFSTGLFLSLKGASSLAKHLVENSLDAYQEETLHALNAWGGLIESFYDGRFFSMIRSGSELKSIESEKFYSAGYENFFSKIMSGYSMEEEDVQDKFNLILKFCASRNEIELARKYEITKTLVAS